MAIVDPRINDYINNSAAFATLVLNHLRKVIHTACSEIKETISGAFPNCEYEGKPKLEVRNAKRIKQLQHGF
jgi:hypothetical protein